jgi:hypothetical protein
MPRRFSWGADMITEDSPPKSAACTWPISAAADVCMPTEIPAASSKSKVQILEPVQVPTPCRNASKQQRHDEKSETSKAHATLFENREREKLLQRIAELETQQLRLELQRDQAHRREAMQEQMVQKVREQLECGVCLLSFNSPVFLDCGHAFCRTCIANWELRQSVQGSASTCPTCRSVVGAPRMAHALHNACVALEALEKPAVTTRRSPRDQLCKSWNAPATQNLVQGSTSQVNRRRSIV